MNTGSLCGLCGGPLLLLGKMGDTTHTRCRNCGMIFSRRAPLKRAPPKTAAPATKKSSAPKAADAT